MDQPVYVIKSVESVWTYKYNGKIYICKVGGHQPITQWFNPEINATEQFPAFEETYFDNILTLG